MPSEDVEVVRALWEESAEWFNAPTDRERYDRIAGRYMAPDVVYEEAPEWPDAGTFRGREALISRFLEYADLLQIRRTRVGDVTDAGDIVLAELRIEILGDAAGEPIEFLWTYTVRVEDGLVTHIRAWYRPQQARRAAGLRES